MRTILAAVIAIILPLAAFAETSIDFLGAKSSGDRVVIEWKTGAEQAATKFEIERAPQGGTNFTRVGSVDAKGSYSFYTFTDETGFQKGTPSPAGLYQYRLRIYSADGSSTYSKPTLVEHSVSGVRRTWGQIKEMFR